jgi:hypothetical protein|tara:strand:+ start:4459 stop:4956 length:498 start_codon:yes stop_codon:yes gene_type:complete
MGRICDCPDERVTVTNCTRAHCSECCQDGTEVVDRVRGGKVPANTFNSYISQDEFFNQGGGLGTTSLAGGYGSIPRPSFAPIKGGRPMPRPIPTIRPSIPYHTHSIQTGGPNRPRTVGPRPAPRPNTFVGGLGLSGGLTPRPTGGLTPAFRNASGGGCSLWMCGE